MTDFIQSFGSGDNIDFPEFKPQAGYFVAMDCLVYLNEDVSYRAVRLSPWVTVLLHPADERAVGVKIKGFRFIVEQARAILKAQNVDLTDSEVIALLTVLEVAFTASLGERATTEAEAERRRRWQQQVRELAQSAMPMTLSDFSVTSVSKH